MKWNQSSSNWSDCKKPSHCKKVLNCFELQKKFVLFLLATVRIIEKWLFLVVVRIAINLFTINKFFLCTLYRSCLDLYSFVHADLLIRSLFFWNIPPCYTPNERLEQYNASVKPALYVSACIMMAFSLHSHGDCILYKSILHHQFLGIF